MKNYQYLGIIGSTYIATYKPDLSNLIIGGLMLGIGFYYYITDK